MSFVDQSDIQAVGESLMPEFVKTFAPDANVYPEIPHISFDEAMLKYGSDKPDLRNPILISDVTGVFRGSEFGIFANAIENGAVVRAIPAPASADKPRSWFDKLGEYAVKELGLGGLGYIVFADEPKGPVAKKLDADRIAKLHEIAGDNSSLFFVCDNVDSASKAAGKLRNKLGADLGLIKPRDFAICWVDNFPFFEPDEERGGAPAFTHNPFSYPLATLEELDTKNPFDIKAAQFDMVINGIEMCSGGLRNYNPDVMKKCFDIAGYPIEAVEKNFSALYTAFKYGAPPHGGFGFGIDRLISEILGTGESLRETVAFPANQRGQDLLMGSPNEVSEQQLRDVHIQVRKKN